jgi:hypothetical protein
MDDMDDMNAITLAVIQLANAGYKVRPAEGIPGLFDVDLPLGGRDITVNQLLDVAKRYGSPFPKEKPKGGALSLYPRLHLILGGGGPKP